MPLVDIADPIFAKLKLIAEPFVDTPETAVAKAVDFYISAHQSANGASALTQIHHLDVEHTVYSSDTAPNLAFTRPVSIELEGKMLPKSQLYWNPLLFQIVGIAAKKLNNTDKLKQLLLCNYVDGQGDKETGYNFIPESGLSIQAQSASPAWKSIAHLTKKLGLKLDVVFVWENNSKAAYPGKTGRFVIG